MHFSIVFLWVFLCSAVAEGNCPENSIGLKLNSSICYSFHPSLSQYVIAERECNSFGATVISVKNEFTNVYVAQLANSFFEHLEVDEIWTSGHRLLSDKTYQWVDGDQIEDTKLSLSKKSDECVAINLKKGFWKSEDCFLQLPFVCEFVGKEVQNVPPTAIILKDFMSEKQHVMFRYFVDLTTTTATPTTTTSTTTTQATTTTTEPLTCSDSWSYFDVTGYCYKVFKNMNWQNAENKCIEHGAHLVSIHSYDEAVFVAELAKTAAMEHAASVSWAGQPYIGLSTYDSNAHWNWTDGTPVDYLQWGTIEPNNPGIENCGQIWIGDHLGDYVDEVDHHDFNNIRCSRVCNFICKKSPQRKLPLFSPFFPLAATTSSPSSTIKPKECPISWAYNNVTGFCYKKFTNKSNWANAEATCVKHGAHLASIHSREEAVYVAVLAQPTYQEWRAQPWIGLYTNDKNANWFWTDGSVTDYIQWGSTEPNLPGSENCVQIFSTEDASFLKRNNNSLGDYYNWRCHEVLHNFICKQRPE